MPGAPPARASLSPAPGCRERTAFLCHVFHQDTLLHLRPRAGSWLTKGWDSEMRAKTNLSSLQWFTSGILVKATQR